MAPSALRAAAAVLAGAAAVRAACDCTGAPPAAYSYRFPTEAGAAACWSSVCVCYGATLVGTQAAAAGTVALLGPGGASWSLVFPTDPACAVGGGVTPSPTQSRPPPLTPSSTRSRTPAAAASAAATATPSRSPLAAGVTPPPTPSRSPPASAAPSASASGSPPLPSASASASPSPAATAVSGGCPAPGAPPAFTSPGYRILDYLHARGEALALTPATGAPARVTGVYLDARDVNWANVSDTVARAVDAGFNMVLLAFWLGGGAGAVDAAGAWGALPPAARAATLAYAHSKGAVVLASAGGATDEPYASTPGAAYGQRAAAWAVSAGLDGLDLDLEGFAPGFAYPPLTTAQTVAWLVDASKAARAVLCPWRLLMHAPQAPYFGAPGSPTSWAGPTGGYTAVWGGTGPGVVDWFGVQAYNQGPGCYTSAAGLFTRSGADCPGCPGTSLGEIAGYGVPLNRLVVGKPLVAGVDAGSGWVSAGNLGAYFAQAAAAQGWAGGGFVWQWSASAAPAWAAAVRA
jgi:hypothetical protein